MARNIIVADIDGTIADIEHRIHLIKSYKKHWNEFYQKCVDDKPIQKIIDIVKLYAKEGYIIIFCTGRSTQIEKETITWIERNVGLDKIIIGMREEGNHAPDTKVKPELLEYILKKKNLNKEDVHFILEDRDLMVQKWRELGYTCLQVRDGNF